MRTPIIINSLQSQRAVYLEAAIDLYSSASACAEAGDLNNAANLILQALDQERKAGVVGPQVLQLIKPRK